MTLRKAEEPHVLTSPITPRWDGMSPDDSIILGVQGWGQPAQETRRAGIGAWLVRLDKASGICRMALILSSINKGLDSPFCF